MRCDERTNEKPLIDSIRWKSTSSPVEASNSPVKQTNQSLHSNAHPSNILLRQFVRLVFISFDFCSSSHPGAKGWSYTHPTMSTPSFRSAPSYAPEKGVFPLDHFAECKRASVEYLACLDKNGADASACEALSRAYLECRMGKELMAKQPMEELGFRPPSSQSDDDARAKRREEAQKEEREPSERVAGLRTSRR
jgi:cytochrome c oxidase assembly protein subunit 19